MKECANSLKGRAVVTERLKQLARERTPGETFSRHQIAAYCGVSPQAIMLMEKKAMRKIKERMRKKLGLSWEQFHDFVFDVDGGEFAAPRAKTEA